MSKDPNAAAVINKLMFLYWLIMYSVNQSEAAAARKFIAEQLPLTESSSSHGCKFANLKKKITLQTWQEKENH